MYVKDNETSTLLCSVVKNVQAFRARKKCRETQDRDECCPSSWLLVDTRNKQNPREIFLIVLWCYKLA